MQGPVGGQHPDCFMLTRVGECPQSLASRDLHTSRVYAARSRQAAPSRRHGRIKPQLTEIFTQLIIHAQQGWGAGTGSTGDGRVRLWGRVHAGSPVPTPRPRQLSLPAPGTHSHLRFSARWTDDNLISEARLPRAPSSSHGHGSGPLCAPNSLCGG